MDVLGVTGRMGWRLAGFLGAAAAAVLLLLGGGAAPAVSAATAPTAASNQAFAQMEAARLLGQVPLPAGATPASGDASVSGTLGYSSSGEPATADGVDYHRFWTLPGDPQTQIRWIKDHPPAGARIMSTGVGGSPGAQTWSVTFEFPAVPGRTSDELLGVGMADAKGGGTAMRADGTVVWLIPRPANEVVPPGTRKVAVFIQRLGRRAIPVNTVTASAKVQRLVEFIDSLDLEQPGARSCPGNELVLDVPEPAVPRGLGSQTARAGGRGRLRWAVVLDPRTPPAGAERKYEPCQRALELQGAPGVPPAAAQRVRVTAGPLPRAT